MSTWKERIQIVDAAVQNRAILEARTKQREKSQIRRAEALSHRELTAKFLSLNLQEDFESMNREVWESRGLIAEARGEVLTLTADYPSEVKEACQDFDTNRFGFYQYLETSEGGWQGEGGDYRPGASVVRTKFGHYITRERRIVGTAVLNKKSELALKFSPDDKTITIYDSEAEFKLGEFEGQEQGSDGKWAPIHYPIYYDLITQRMPNRHHIVLILNDFNVDTVKSFLDAAFVESCKARIANPFSARIDKANSEKCEIEARIGGIISREMLPISGR